MVKTNKLIKSLVILGAIVGIGFTLFENREALAQRIIPRRTTADGLTPQVPTTPQVDIQAPLEQPSLANRQQIQIVAPVRTFVTAPAPIVQAQPSQRLPLRTERFIQQEISRPSVLRPEFLARQDILNPKAFNQRKFGTNVDLLRSGLSKPEPQRSRAEKLQIEADKARQVFDARSITNF